ncbi:hypothetical protein [Streptomyces sp. NPDC088736]|uniref:hypothetical protein n=1 Tax=Streptomyces sp. NPDC088736 TaxID=3365881 RepID=UPI00381AD04F
MSQEERPFIRADYERIYALLCAYDLKVTGDDEAPMWEVLRRVHEDTLQSNPVPLDDLVGERGVAREQHHALLVLEALMRGKTTVRPIAGDPPLTVCLTPGCPNLTFSGYCPGCELAQG